MLKRIIFLIVLVFTTQTVFGVTVRKDELARARQWANAKFNGITPSGVEEAGLYVFKNWGNEPIGKKINRRHNIPMNVAGVEYEHGLFCVAPTVIKVKLPGPAEMFTAVVGIDSNENTRNGKGTVKFIVTVGGQEKFRSDLLTEAKAANVKVDLAGATEFTLMIDDLGSADWDTADWADAQVMLKDGRKLWLDELPFKDSMVSYIDGVKPPFSFLYDGKNSDELLQTWPLKRTNKKLDNNRTEHTLVYTDPKTQLVVRCTGIEYHDFPTVEWTVYFKNTGSRDTPILENIQSLDIQLTRGNAGEFKLHHQAGDLCVQNSYQPHVTTLTSGLEKVFAPRGGRPTDTQFPYFNLELQDQGVIIVVGWIGQWSARFKRDSANDIQIIAGQELTHLKLHPGEEIRTPLMVLQFYKGDWIRSQNIWRRWMFAHNYHRPGGKLRPPQWNGNSSLWFHEMTKANEDCQNMFVDRYIEEGLKLDYWWMDAGWYVGAAEKGWPFTGTWEVDRRPNRFPNGLRGVADHINKLGVKTIVWFEPERVYPGTWLAEDRPQWVLGGKGGGLLNMGNPEARTWLTKHISKLIKKERIAVYRQDYNIDPLNFWRGSDAEDRQGITENLYAQGYLAYWDGLLKSDPKLHIDSCSSGGRRNDLETARRSVPYLRSDYIFEPIGQQGHIYGISFWLPFHGGPTRATDPYVFRSNMCPAMLTCWDMRNKDLDYDAIRTLTSQWRKIAHLYLTDYYPLTPYSIKTDAWLAWQFNSPETGQGLVQAFRRPNSSYLAAQYKLHGLEADATYTITNFDEPGTTTATGRELMEKGLRVEIENLPGAVVFTYKKI